MHNRLFAIGDIHGCFNSLKKLVEEKMQITQSDKVVLLGDYIDRGSQSKQVIDFIIELKDKGFDIVALRGNHEEMLLEAYNEELVSRWILNGGSETLKSFGIKSIKTLDTHYLDFFRSLPMYFEFNNCLFVHAGFNDEIDDPFEDTYHMIWHSREKYKHPSLKDKTIIHGHRVIPSPDCDDRIRNKNQVIDLDTGCVFSNYSNYGRLTGLEVNTGSIFSVQSGS